MGLKRLSLLAVLVAGALALAPLPAPAQQQVLSPSQAAFLKAENRRIEDYFVLQVSRIVGIQPEQVRRAMPDERRITVAVSRLISALEMDLGRPLTDEQTAAIIAADEERRAALVRVREGAVLR
ncbi:hypothetical protein [Azoarcus taiwanensis]|uniref:hypothetical protein n=1 Tax=Azoarcus taiwanensis TaxID=666964 RepID=UPI001B7D039F|nr:hypothetical protein [Azoarcus taiwanensis]